MAQYKTLTTIPRLTKQIRVFVLGVDIEFSQESFEAWADVRTVDVFPEPNEFGALWTMEAYRLHSPREGRVQLTFEAAKLLTEGTNHNETYLVDEAHVEWER